MGKIKKAINQLSFFAIGCAVCSLTNGQAGIESLLLLALAITLAHVTNDKKEYNLESVLKMN